MKERKTPSWCCASGTRHPLPRFTGMHTWCSQFQSLIHTKYSLCIFSVTHSVPGCILRFHDSKHSNHTISLSSTSISCPYLPPMWRYTHTTESEKELDFMSSYTHNSFNFFLHSRLIVFLERLYYARYHMRLYETTRSKNHLKCSLF